MKLRRLRAGCYATLDGRYQIEHQDGWTECSHPLCEQLHTDRRRAQGDVADMHLVPYTSWHIWDMQRDDYACHEWFDTKRAAEHWLERMIQTAY